MYLSSLEVSFLLSCRPLTIDPIYSNVEAKPVTKSGEIREMLKRGLLSPVLWENIITNMLKDGIQKGIEIGPGRVLQGLARRIDKSFQCSAVNNVETLEQIKN